MNSLHENYVAELGFQVVTTLDLQLDVLPIALMSPALEQWTRGQLFKASLA